MNEDDRHRLGRMRHYADRAVAWLGAGTAESLEVDERELMALVKAVQLVGEAAFRISEALKAAEPGLPWSEAVRMRHVLVHDYPDIDTVVLVDTIRKDLPPLIAELDRLLAEHPE